MPMTVSHLLIFNFMAVSSYTVIIYIKSKASAQCH
jgi:hypothetical protein